MATIETKFSIGDSVTHFTGIPGMVIAIFHRGGENTYEFSFLKDDAPSCVNAQECELYPDSDHNMGFKRKT